MLLFWPWAGFDPDSISSSIRLVRRSNQLTLASTPLWFCLFVQLLFVPILWTHVSDLPQVAGRFSYAFATVVAANVGSIAVILGLLVMAQAD